MVMSHFHDNDDKNTFPLFLSKFKDIDTKILPLSKKWMEERILEFGYHDVGFRYVCRRGL